VVSLWPYGGSYGQGPLFVGSMLAAIAAPLIWIGASGDLAAIRPGAVNVLAVSAGLGGQAGWKLATGATDQRLVVFAAAVAAIAALSAVLLVLARKVPWRDPRPTPWLVRMGFALFVLVLLFTGGLLVQRVQVFPWVLDPDSAMAYGVLFLGAAAYFIYAVLEPVWSNAKGQLLGFLAYDAVLLIPYIRMWPSTAGDQRLGLAVYLGVIVVSGAIALWFLVFSPIWRLGRGQGQPLRDWRRRAQVDSSDAL
jgi:hypothetical protein